MCRMCSYYQKIDLKHLPTSNPWLEASPIDVAVPDNIIVESPEAQKRTAWTNMHRFPSLNQSACSAKHDATTSPSPKAITIRGPTQLAKQRPATYDPRHVQRKPLATSTETVQQGNPLSRRLSRQGRVLSFPPVTSADSDHESPSCTSSPDPPSPVSDDEFEYLPTSQLRFKSAPRSHPPRFSIGYRMPVPVPTPLRIRNPQSSTQWVNEACANF